GGNCCRTGRQFRITLRALGRSAIGRHIRARNFAAIGAVVRFGWEGDSRLTSALGGKLTPRTDYIWIGEPALSASGTIDGERRSGIEHRLDVAFTIEVEIGSVQHERDLSDFCVCLGKVQGMDRSGRLV